MAHAHGHDHSRGQTKRALGLTLVLTTAFLVAEVIGGLLTGSLALLADAGHMLSDSVSLGLALFAVWLAQRPATPQRTFGLNRAEILAALANGVTLVAISIWIFVEAIRRLDDPGEVLGGWMLAIAVMGLFVNGAAIAVLHRGGGSSLNVSAAMRHVIADFLGSIGVIVAALIIVITGWEYADPIVSLLIAVLILGSSWTILRDTTQILLEGAPPGIDVSEVGREMASVPGVVEVHDLHIWMITSGFPALAAHVLVAEDDDCHLKRLEVAEMLHSRFGIDHATLQMDHTHPHLLQIEQTPAKV
ncbi:MAG: cobalt-zinc-cadmium efflux system protein [Solirubrobacterales bacterium]|jgi:cobalt-zinc-cadmium efflux system protein|nr:cobalt-zinc-cadmium efflux system protein [Solirubrobacterales bacterium]